MKNIRFIYYYDTEILHFFPSIFLHTGKIMCECGCGESELHKAFTFSCMGFRASILWD